VHLGQGLLLVPVLVLSPVLVPVDELVRFLAVVLVQVPVLVLCRVQERRLLWALPQQCGCGCPHRSLPRAPSVPDLRCLNLHALLDALV
jgi:hypothetical protein